MCNRENKWEIDVSVLIIFFNRSEELKKTFEEVKKARPRRLLLWQDGPRNQSDMDNIQRCRDVVSDIDWDCEVYRKYNEKNYGCDPSTFYSHKWAFSIVDKCIVLEDDFVADQSFFPYCKELLDRYENDTRINHICGMNVLGIYKDTPYDYFFSYTGSNAWASWKRVIDGWDESYSFLDDEDAIQKLKKKYGKRFNQWYQIAKQRRTLGVPYWESILCFDSILNSRYAIIPKKNMVSNIGLTADSTHSQTEMKYLTKKEQMMFKLPVYEMSFPMKHPKYVLPEYGYNDALDRFTGVGHPLISSYRFTYRMIKYVQYGTLFKKIREKIKRRK